MAELNAGKFWGVEHDIRVVTGKGVHGHNDNTSNAGKNTGDNLIPPFEACFDHIFYTTVGLKLNAVRETLTPEQRELVYVKGQTLPNAWHPSDHLPMAVALEWGQ
jgi:mRNA deadenylase 3'-5' endonuclease subunit Ccr4